MQKDTINLVLDSRKTTGKAVKHLRAEGIVPAIIHNHGKPSINVQGDSLAVLKVWREAGKHHTVSLKTDSHNYTVLIKDVTFDPKKHHLTHIVFNAVQQNQKVEAEVPIRPRFAPSHDNTPAERVGLIVLTQLESVDIKSTPSNIPDIIEYDAEKLVKIGDHISIADLIVPEGVEIVTEPEHAVATVYEPSALASANEAEETAESSEAEADSKTESSQPETPAEDAKA